MKPFNLDGATAAMISIFVTILGGLILFGVRHFIKEIVRMAIEQFKEVAENLSNELQNLTKTIKEEQNYRVENQKEIAAMRSTLFEHGKDIERVDRKIDIHIRTKH